MSMKTLTARKIAANLEFHAVVDLISDKYQAGVKTADAQAHMDGALACLSRLSVEGVSIINQECALADFDNSIRDARNALNLATFQFEMFAVTPITESAPAQDQADAQVKEDAL